ncbi:MAG: AraC family transcriptional regulator [Bacteroidota bacterium]
MKSQYEHIQTDADRSFRLLRNPQLNDVFYWHLHPEFELVYIEAEEGPRQVGTHISRYHGSDLVLIGSNIPHLNFDYGVRGSCDKVVLQIHPDFRTQHLAHIPEVSGIQELLDRSQQGLSFHGETKAEVGKRMQAFHQLSAFAQFVEILQIFNLLAHSQQFDVLHPQPYISPFSDQEQFRLQQIYAFVEQHFQEKISLAQVAASVHLSREAFCRYFKKTTGQTFIGYLNQYRISHARRLLMQGKNVSEACFASGFESLSYFNRTFNKVVGENPGKLRRRVKERGLG